MSKKWMGYLNHNLQHDTSLKPTHSPSTAAIKTVVPNISDWGCIPMTTSHISRC